MIPLGMLGQIYAVCAAIGVIFILGNAAVGHLGEVDSGDSGSDFGSGDDSGSDFGGGDDAGSDFGGGDTGSHPGAGNMKLAPLFTVDPSRSKNLTNSFGSMLMSFFSPMNWAVHLAFFGLAGLFLGYSFPVLGLLTIVPALIVSVLAGQLFKGVVRWMFKNLHSSTHARDADLIGQIAEVNTPIQDGRTGEVTYVIHSKRLQAAARPAKVGVEFKRGSKVLIVGSQDQVVLVEPCDLDEQFTN